MPYLTALDPAMYTVNELIERSMPTATTDKGDAQSSPALVRWFGIEHIRRCVTCSWEGEWTRTLDHDGGGKCPACGGELEDAE